MILHRVAVHIEQQFGDDANIRVTLESLHVAVFSHQRFFPWSKEERRNIAAIIENIVIQSGSVQEERLVAVIAACR